MNKLVMVDPDDHGDGRCTSIDDTSTDGRCRGGAKHGRLCDECDGEIRAALNWMAEMDR